MIEKIILDYLNLKFDCYTEKQNRNGKYLVIEKVGGGINNKIKRASIAVQSYADALYEASALNEEMKAYMDEIVRLPEISRCKLDSDYNFTDTQMKKYRYQAVFDIIHY